MGGRMTFFGSFFHKKVPFLVNVFNVNIKKVLFCVYRIHMHFVSQLLYIVCSSEM